MAGAGRSNLMALNKIIEGSDVTYLGRRTVEFDISLTSPLRKDRPPVLIYPRVETFYVPDSDIESIETASVTSSIKDDTDFPEEYRITGLIWETPGLTNTCNVDSFLSGWVRRVRQTHNRSSELIVTTDLAGNALLQIADHAMLSGNGVDSAEIKKIWYKAALASTGELEALKKPLVDCVGISVCSVFQHLRNHSSYYVESYCDCGTVFHRDFFFEIPRLYELGNLSETSNYPQLRTPKCLRCARLRRVVTIQHDPNNWLMPIIYNGTGSHISPPLHEVPKFLRVGGINFKLGYVSYSQRIPSTLRMTHEVSLQNIRGEWYLYDGLISPKFKRWTEDSYNVNNARMNTLVYFKQLDAKDTD